MEITRELIEAMLENAQAGVEYILHEAGLADECAPPKHRSSPLTAAKRGQHNRIHVLPPEHERRTPSRTVLYTSRCRRSNTSPISVDSFSDDEHR